jgi:hypothetical protein
MLCSSWLLDDQMSPIILHISQRLCRVDTSLATLSFWACIDLNVSKNSGTQVHQQHCMADGTVLCPNSYLKALCGSDIDVIVERGFVGWWN